MQGKGFHLGRFSRPAVGHKRYHQHRNETIQARHRPHLKAAAPGTIHFPSEPCHVRAAVKSSRQNRKPRKVKRAKNSPYDTVEEAISTGRGRRRVVAPSSCARNPVTRPHAWASPWPLLLSRWFPV